MKSDRGLELNQALELLKKFQPDLVRLCYPGFCEIAGSVRRSEPRVGDIEILLVPFTHFENDLFGASIATSDKLQIAMPELLKKWGATFNSGKEKKISLTIDRFPIELYVATIETWGVELAIRTGPAELSKKLVTQRNKGGLLPSNCQIKDGWNFYRGNDFVPIPTEEDFFKELGLVWIHPSERTAEMRLRQ